MSALSSNSKRKLVLGCIADDVTGATDLAINLVQGGMRVVQLLDVPNVNDLQQLDADAVVVGLKTRSIPSLDAVRKSVTCVEAFQQCGIERVYFKYCSTFDSTPAGNIGPVAVALSEALGVRQTIFCPAFPRAGRTVYQGHLFVHDRLLNESGMEHHPLNPMTDANLLRLLSGQCDRQVGLLSYSDIEQDRIPSRLGELQQLGYSCVVADACCESHLQQIATSVADMRLVTGGSGLGRYLPDAYRQVELLVSDRFVPRPPEVLGRSLIVAGSCSVATRGQVAWMQDKIPCLMVDAHKVMRNKDAALHDAVDWGRTIPSDLPLLVASTTGEDQIAELQATYGGAQVAAAVEEFLANVAASFVSEFAVTRMIVAGGETSGAVVNRLGIQALRIDAEICAGIPWTETLGEQRLAVAFKSGNFGDENFFEHALEMLP